MFFLYILYARCWIVVCCARAICQIAQISSTIRAWFADLSDFSNTLHTILGESSQTIIVWMWSSIGTWIFDIDLLCCLCLFFFHLFCRLDRLKTSILLHSYYHMISNLIKKKIKNMQTASSYLRLRLWLKCKNICTNRGLNSSLIYCE